MASRSIPVTPDRLTSGSTASLSRQQTSESASSYVLIVDDHRDAADALVRLLTLLGREARAVYDGSACLAEFERQAPALAFIDMAMPVLNGLEVARRIRERAEWNSVALVALTGSGQKDDQARSQAAGFAAHLTKPVAMALLEQILEQLLAPQSEPARSGVRSRGGGPAKR